MTFTQIFKNIFAKKQVQAKDNANEPKKGKFKAFLVRLPGGFMLPISVMAISGLFMGVGAAIQTNTSAKTFGLFLNAIGNPIFGAMPTLFLIAIVIAFTDEAGVAVFAGVTSFLVFNSLQVPFIETTGDGVNGIATFLGITTSLDIQQKMYSIVGTNLGIPSINTSILGGIVIGLIVAWIYNHFYMIELPAMVSFFGGKRFVAIISIILMIPITFLFLLIWPWIGLAFAYFGEYSGKVSGLDSFVFGFVERAALPFGLTRPLIAPLQYTSAGGDVLDLFSRWTGTITKINGQDILEQANAESLALLKENLLKVEGLSNQNILDITHASGFDISNVVLQIVRSSTNPDLVEKLAGVENAFNYQPETSLNGIFINKIIANGTYTGDIFGWLAVNGSGIENVTYQINGQTYTQPVFSFIDDQLGLSLGRFSVNGYIPIHQFAVPSIGAAMIFAAPKERRKEAFSICFPAAITSFLVGVTEPLEYTFLFLAPWFYFGFHALMEGLAFLFTSLLNVHIASTFSAGLIDTIIYGMIPVAKGTAFYWSYLIGVIYAPIYFFFFYWWIKHFDLPTPGRGGSMSLLSKKDYQANQNSTLGLKEALLVKAMGGWANIKSYNTCASRLRYDINNKKLVDEQALKAAGAMGTVWNGNNLQTIIGMTAEQVNTNIKKHQGANLDAIITKALKINNQKKPKPKLNKK